MKFRKRPVEVEAIRWAGDNAHAIWEWTSGGFHEIGPEDRVDDPDHTAELFVAANSKWLGVPTGEWIIKDKLGFYPCRDEVFRETYEPA